MLSFPVNWPSHPHCEASVSACTTVGDFSSLHPSPFFSFSCSFSGSFTGPKTSVASVLMFSPSRQVPTLRPISPLVATFMGLPRKCCKQKTYRQAKPFRCDTYKKLGGGYPPFTMGIRVTRDPQRRSPCG